MGVVVVLEPSLLCARSSCSLFLPRLLRGLELLPRILEALRRVGRVDLFIRVGRPEPCRVRELLEVEIVPNFKVLGPKLGKDIPRVQQLLKAGDSERQGDDVVGGGSTLTSAESDLRTRPREGFAVADEGGLAVAVDTDLDEELEDEGLARELVHFIQGQRKDSGFEVADRIEIDIAVDDRLRRVLDRFGDEIQRETLCIALTVRDGVEGAAFDTDGCGGTLALRRTT